MATNVLYLSYDGMTDPLGQSQVLPYLIGLSKCDLNFTLISFEKEKNFKKRNKKISIICEKNNIEWFPLKYTKKPPVLSTLYDIQKMKRLVTKLQEQRYFQIVHCRSYITSLIGLHLKRKNKIKFIFDMRGFWADERVEGGLWNLRNPLFLVVYRFFKKKEKDFLRFSDSVISLTESGKAEMLTWKVPGLNSSKINVIPCVADFTLFKMNNVEKRNDAKLMLGMKKDDFVLSYIGSIGTWYLLDEMVHFFSVLKKQFKSAKFLILSPADSGVIEKTFQKYDLNFRDAVIKFVERDELPKVAHASNYSIFFIKPVFSKKSSSPTKMGEILAMGIPLICNEGVGDVKNILEKTKSGFCISNFDEKTYNEVIIKIKQCDGFTPQSIRNAAESIFDLKQGLNSYLNIYKSL